MPDDVDNAAFLEAVQRVHAEPLAMWPLTLQLLTRLYTRTGGFPERAANLYEQGLLSLCEEQNPQRRDAGAVGDLAPAERLAVARRIAAVATFGGRPAIWTGVTSQGDDDFVSAEDLSGGTEPCDALEVDVTTAAVRQSFQTGLFTGRGPQHLGWAHATYADYLAGGWVTANKLTPEQIRVLFFSTDERIYPQLRNIAAWAVAIAPDRHGWMVAEDPESFLGQVDIPDDSLRTTIVGGIVEVAARGRLLGGYTIRFQGLAHPNLAEQLRPYLHDQRQAVRYVAIRIAEDCHVHDLISELTAIALDPAADTSDRVAAAWTVTTIEPATNALLPLVKNAEMLGDDLDDELLGAALTASWPHSMSTSEALSAARLPRRRNLIGAYRTFLDTLGRALGDDDLSAALDWLGQAGEVADDELLASISGSALRLAMSHLDDEHAFQVVRDVARRRGRQFRPLLDDNLAGQEQVGIPDNQRRQLAMSLLDDDNDDLVWALVDYRHGLGLIRPADLTWLIDHYATASPEKRPRLAKLFRLIYRIDDAAHANAILELPADHPLVRDVVGDWIHPVELNSEHARQLREQWDLLHDRSARAAVAVDDDEVNQRIATQIDAALGGDPAGFWQAVRLVTVRPGTRYYCSEFQPDLTAHPRWQLLDPALKDQIAQAAMMYLRAGRCDPDRWLGQPIDYLPARAGYRALILLMRVNQAALATLEPSVWQEWAPIIIGWPATANGASWIDKELLLSYAHTHALNELYETLIRVIRAAIERGERLLSVWQECQALWCEPLAAELMALASRPMPSATREDLLEIIAHNEPSRVRPLLVSWLGDDARAEDAQRTKHAAQLLLQRDAAATWPTVYQVLLDEPEFGKEVVLATAANHRDRWPDLQPQQLADLYLWLTQHFPRAQDPQLEGAHAIGPREEVGYWRDNIPDALRHAGTPEAVAAIRRIAEGSPAEPWLMLHVAAAEEGLRSASWAPTALAQLQRLADDHRTRLVRSAAELLHLTQDAFAVIQQRLQADTPEAQLLWDTRIRRPKSEDEASDYLRQRLTDLLGGHGVVVNREVQVRRIRPAGIPERTDLRIDAAAADPQAEVAVVTVVGEVKAAWNADLMTAMESQLASRYMVDIRAAYGLYIVLWFDPSWWAVDQGPRDRERVVRLDRADVLAELRNQADTLAADGYHIDVILLDMSYERPVADRA